MSVLVGRDTRLLVQGITGQAASAHTRRMLAYGTKVVGGVVPGRGGGALDGVPIYDTVAVPYQSGGDIYPDVKVVMNNDLVSALIDSNGQPTYNKYNVLFVGSNVDHAAMTSL